MKTFKEICQLSQKDLKAYMHKYLSSKKYKVINEKGFLYAEGDVPVLLLAHMDTVHKQLCTNIVDMNGRLCSPQGIGGDDRCGIFIIMNLVKELHCSVLLCEDEEIGGVGAREFTKSEYIKDLGVNYMVEFDRKGNNDAVFYSCDNEKFTEFITKTTGFKKDSGSFSDISVIAPAAKIAAVNLSSGYYNAHTTSEYVVYEDMMNTVEVAKKLIETESEPYEYIKKKYTYSNLAYDDDDEFYERFASYGGGTYGKQTSLYGYNKNKRNNYELEFILEMEVVWVDDRGEETACNVCGSTKAECWAKFFMENPEVSFSMIYDYSFC